MSTFTLILARTPLDDVRMWTFEFEDTEQFDQFYQKLIMEIGLRKELKHL